MKKHESKESSAKEKKEHMAKKMPRKERSLEYMKAVQAFGEQHPDFHASHGEYKRRFPEMFGKKK